MTQTPTIPLVNNSPWLHQLNRTRPLAIVEDNLKTDVAIVGGGIAGVATAYFILKNTDKKVVLLEADKIAHAATGHNAGQMVTYFERPFSDLVKEFGLTMAADAQLAIESSWELVEEIFRDTQLRTPFWQFTGYAASKDVKEILVHLRNNHFRLKAGLNPALIMIAKGAPGVEDIPKKYNSLFAFMPHENILSLLETNDKRYIAALPGRKGCMNSALFCEELLGFLLAKYPERLKVGEQCMVNEVVLEKDNAMLLLSEDRQVQSNQVVLCTNGFEKLTVTNKAGREIDTKFHHMIRGSIGYMAGYLENFDKQPTAISFLPPKQDTSDVYKSEPYYYLTRRPFEFKANQKHSLICVGGPEALVDDTSGYKHEHPYPDEAQKQIDSFLRQTYKYVPAGPIEYKFKWHGLMGYTPSGVRCIGPEPRNPILHYNLGCNGVGLLHSIYGGMKISRYLKGEALPSSIFDPKQ